MVAKGNLIGHFGRNLKSYCNYRFYLTELAFVQKCSLEVPKGLKMCSFIGKNSYLDGWNLFFKDLGLDELTQGSGKREEIKK